MIRTYNMCSGSTDEISDLRHMGLQISAICSKDLRIKTKLTKGETLLNILAAVRSS